jgi:hypothetical protein
MDKTLQHYRIYCYLNLAWYAFLCFLGFTGLFLARSADPEVLPPESRGVFQLACFGLVVMGVGFGLANLSLMRQPKNPKAHLAHFVNICLGISTCLLAPYCIWLAIRWQKPEVKALFDQQDFKL